MGARGEIHSTRYVTQYGQKTYFFNIKENRFSSLFVSIVESIKKESFDSSFQRHQVAVFDIDWPAFLGFLRKAQENLLANKFSWRGRLIGKGEKRCYDVSFNRKSRIVQVLLTEKKADDLEEEGRTISVDASDFSKFIEKLDYTLGHCN